MNLYLLVNLLVLCFPLLLSFDRRVRFFGQWGAALPAILMTGILFIAEDIAAAGRGHWDFSTVYAGEFRILGLPPGEWLFFVTVPYACLFTYACVRAYVREGRVPVPRWSGYIAAAAAFTAAVLFRNQGYTRSVMILTGAALTSLSLLKPELLQSRHFWIGLGLTYLAFLAVNGLLTALPVVTYGPDAIWGVRVATIPLEDFFYSFSLLTINFTLFRLFLDRGAGGETAPGRYAAPGGRGSTAAPPRPYRFLERP